jgi:hypothetical protein
MAKTKIVIAAFLWMLVGIMVVPFLVRELPFLVRQFAQPTNVVRQPTNAEGYNAQRVQSAAVVNVPTDHAWEAPALTQATIEATFAKIDPIVQEKPQPVSQNDPRIIPPIPQYSRRLTPEEACQLLSRDPEEVQLCVEYPERETILNSAVNRRPPAYMVVPSTE